MNAPRVSKRRVVFVIATWHIGSVIDYCFLTAVVCTTAYMLLPIGWCPFFIQSIQSRKMLILWQPYLPMLAAEIRDVSQTLQILLGIGYIDAVRKSLADILAIYVVPCGLAALFI